MIGLSISSKSDWGGCIVLIAQIPTKKTGTLWSFLWSFLLQRLLFICHSLAGNTVINAMLVLPAVTCICQISCRNGYVGLLVLHILPLLNPGSSSLASLNILYRHYIWTGWTGFISTSCEISFQYCQKLHDFAVTIPRCYKDIYVNSFFPCTAQLELFFLWTMIYVAVAL